MKLRHNILFISVILCLFWPLGLIILIQSNKAIWKKWLMALGGLLIFCGLLFPAFIRTDPFPNENAFDLTVTRKSLTVGQSGGLSVTTDHFYYTDYTAECNNDILKINNNVYTAVNVGSCEIRVSFGNQTRTVQITVTEGKETDQTVYASPTGKRYHSSQSHAGANGLPFSEEEALQSGKTPCKVCWK